MKAANKIIRTQRLVPEVYADQSRDFQLFTKLADAVYNSCYYNAESIKYVTDPKNINSKLLSLLADKFGIDKADAESLTDIEVRYILMCLPQLIRYKGSLAAIHALINMYFKIYHISGTYEVEVVNKSAVVQDITIADHTIILGLETIVQSTRLLQVMAKYLLPPGYSFFIYFYTDLKRTDNLIDDDSITLLYRSVNLNSQIDQEIPDFIYNNTYLHHSIISFNGDGVTTTYSVPTSTMDIYSVTVGKLDCTEYTYSKKDNLITFNTAPDENKLIEIEVSLSDKSRRTIGAVDAIRLSGIDTQDSNEFFVGFCTVSDLDTIKNNYITASDYDPTREDPNSLTHYKNFDVAKFKDGTKKVYITRSAKEEDYYQLYSYSQKQVNRIFYITENSSYLVLEDNTKNILSIRVNGKLISNFTFNTDTKVVTFIDHLEVGDVVEILISVTNLLNPDPESENPDYDILNEKFYEDITDNTAEYNRYIQVKAKTGFKDKYAHAGWKTLNTGSLIITDETTNTTVGNNQVKEIGEIYYFNVSGSTCNWNLLNFRFTCDTLPSDTTSIKDFDVCCLLEKIPEDERATNIANKRQKKVPYLYRDNEKETRLSYKKSIDAWPRTAENCGLYYNLNDQTYYIYLENSLEINELKFKGNDVIIDEAGQKLGYDLTLKCNSVKEVYINNILISTDKYKVVDNKLIFIAEADWPEETADLRVIIDTHWIKCTEWYDSSSQLPIDITLKYQTLNCVDGETTYTFDTDIYLIDTVKINRQIVKKYKVDYNQHKIILNSAPTQGSTLDLIGHIHKNNVVTWKRGGSYYIWYNGKWNLYTYPLYFTKLIQIGAK